MQKMAQDKNAYYDILWRRESLDMESMINWMREGDRPLRLI
jgi:hypothetical protein